MSDDRFIDRVRLEAHVLRHEPREEVLMRLRARVRSRVAAAPPTVAQLLAAWFRPLGVALGGIALVASIAVVFVQQELHEAGATVDSIATSADAGFRNAELLGVE
jgi:hypothetical protein